MWPSFKLIIEIIKTNILGKFHSDCFENVTSKVLTRSSFDLTWWPYFWLQVTQFQTWPTNHQDKHFEQDSWWLLHKCDHYSVNKVLYWWPGDLVFDPTWPIFELDLRIIKTNILSKIHDDCFKNVTARVLTRFSVDLARWPCFWTQVTQFRTWPKIRRDKHCEHDECLKNVTARVSTRLSLDLAWWPSFWPHVTQFQTWPRNHQDKQMEQDSWWLLEKCDR